MARKINGNGEEVSFDLPIADATEILFRKFNDPKKVLSMLREFPQYRSEIDKKMFFVSDTEAEMKKRQEEFEKFSKPDPLGKFGNILESAARAANPLTSAKVIGEKLRGQGVRMENGKPVIQPSLANDPEFVLAVMDVAGSALPVARGVTTGLGAVSALGKGAAAKKGAETAVRQFAADTFAAASGGAAVGGAIQEGITDRMALTIIGLLGGLTGGGIGSVAADVRAPRTLRTAEDIEFTKAGLLEGKPGAEAARKAEERLAGKPVGSEKAEEFFRRQAQQAEEVSEGQIAKGFDDEILGQELREGRFDFERTVGELPREVGAIRQEAGKMLGAIRDPAIAAIGEVPGLNKTVVRKIDDVLREQGVIFKEGKPIPVKEINALGISKSAADVVFSVREAASNTKTLSGLSNILRTFDDKIGGLIVKGELGNRKAPILVQTRKLIKSQIDEVLDKDPIGKKVGVATKEFAEVVEPTNRINNLITKKIGKKRIPKNPEEFSRSFFRDKAQPTLADDLVILGKRNPRLLENSRLAMIQELFSRAKRNPDNPISSKLLDDLWNSTTKGAFKAGVKEKLFTPEQIKTMDDMVTLFKRLGPKKAALSGAGAAEQGRRILAERFGSAWGWIGSLSDFVFVRRKAKNVFRDFRIAPETSFLGAVGAGQLRQQKETARALREKDLRERFKPPDRRGRDRVQVSTGEENGG